MSTVSRAWIAAPEAARLLGVSRATLYAYVSRGLVRSQPTPAGPRQRVYAREDVERLRRRTEERRAPDKAVARALQWGMPVLESGITLIDGRRLFYRGRDVLALAREQSLEDVATVIWGEPAGIGAGAERRVVTAGASVSPARGSFIARSQALLAMAADGDPAAVDLSPAAVARTGRRILRLLTRAAGGVGPGDPIHLALARGWRAGRTAADVIRAALVLCADHELNVSSFTARCVASAGSNPYAVVLAGLAALGGPRHGGAGARTEAMLASMRRASPLRGAVAARLQRGERIEGFGHPLYPGGDPRATLLLHLLEERFPRSAEYRFIRRFAEAAADAIVERPNLDFALAALTRVLKLPGGAPIMLFAIGRTVGWIGHAMEQYATGQLIRPRARYVGVTPAV